MGRIYDAFDKMNIKPTISKVKSHMTAKEMVVFSRRNADMGVRH